MLFVVFFFSSRRRHTRLVSDWSSDVCSSDLTAAREVVLDPLLQTGKTKRFNAGDLGLSEALVVKVGQRPSPPERERSEERRVGKECRGRGSPEQEKKKTANHPKARQQRRTRA